MPPSELKVFQRRLQNLDYTRKRMEDLFRVGKLSKRDVCAVYEALFLRAVTRFESFLEELFFGILEKRVTYRKSRSVLIRITHHSRKALYDIVLREKSYLNWMPFKKTQERADLYLLGGRPFSDLELADKDVMTNIWTIRNSIAHDSEFAKQQFKKRLLQKLTLRKDEKTPAGFLRSPVTATANRFDVYIGELGRIAGHLCSPTTPPKRFPPTP